MKKNKILLIGYSQLSRKRLINVFIKNKIQFSVASKSYLRKIEGAFEQFSNYNDALKNSNANIAYISLPNSLHFYWSKKALLSGYHVIVDKPICEKISETQKLIDLAKRKKRLLSEAIFYNYHRQINEAKKIIKKRNDLKSLIAEFIIPFPKKNSLLMSNKLKGGTVMDMGPYASSLHRIFFNKKILSTNIQVKKNLKNLPISFRIDIKYSKDQSYCGIFKFGGEYKNELSLFGKNRVILLKRVFSPPDNLKLSIKIINQKKVKILKIPYDNCFENYLSELFEKINNKKFSFYLDQIKKDHLFRSKISRKII